MTYKISLNLLKNNNIILIVLEKFVDVSYKLNFNFISYKFSLLVFSSYIFCYKSVVSFATYVFYNVK